MKVQIKHRIKGFVKEELSPLLDLLDRIVKSINDNPYTEYEDVTVLTPTNEFAVTCKTLNKVPVSYIIVKKDKACDVYTSSPDKWNNNILYLRSSVVNATITIRVS